MAILFNKKFLFSLLSVVYCSFSIAQVNVNVNATPPFRPQISAYESFDFSKISITLTNTTSDPLSLTLKAKLNRIADNYTLAETNVVSQPISTAITLNPFESRSLTRIEVEDVFRNTRLEYDQSIVNSAATSGIIPQGEYELCVIPHDNTSLLPVADELTCCSNPIIISYTEPPQIISVNTSDCGEDVAGAKQFSSLIFTWSPSIVLGINQPKYRFQLYENLSESVNSDNQVFAGNPVVDIGDINVPTLYINPNNYNLLNNVRYIFRVQVYDPTNNNVFQNDGYSQSCSFRMTNIEASDDLPDGIISNYSTSISFPRDMDTLPFEYVPIIQKISPQNRSLSEIRVAYQQFNIGIPEIGKTIIFEEDEISESNPNDRYSLHLETLEPVNSMAYGDIFNVTTATAFIDNDNLLPSGGIENQTFVSGMTKPAITDLQRRGTKKNQFKIRYLPGRPPSKILPDDIEYIIENDESSFPSELVVNQKLCLEYKDNLEFDFPEKLQCKDFSFTYDLNTVTEEQILQDLYSLKEWDFDLPDSTITALRIGWLTDPTDTTSVIINASEIHIVNRDNIDNRSACIGVESYDGFHVGDTVCIAGGIQLKALEITEENRNGTYNGRGWVRIPVWDEKFMIDFENLQIEAGGTVVGGTAEAVNIHENLVPKGLNRDDALAVITAEENRKILFDTDVEERGDSIARTLPYLFNVPGTESKLFVWKLVFDKDSASAYTYYQVPMFGDTLEFVSLSSSVKPSCDNTELMKLSLISDYDIPLPGAEGNKISIRPNSQSGTTTHVQFGCDGIFREGRIAGFVHLDSSLFTPAEGDENTPMDIPFDASLDVNGNFLGSVIVPKFRPGGIEYLEIDTTEFVFDFSRRQNHPQITPPVTGPTPAWVGFYAKDLTARFTQVFKAESDDNDEENETEEITEIAVEHLSVSEDNGFNTNIYATNIIPYSRRWTLGGWRYALDTINIEFKHSELFKSFASGIIKTPLDTGSNVTDIRLGFEKSRIFGNTQLGTEVYFEAMGADLDVRSSSLDLSYSKTDGLQVKLALNTDFDAKYKNGNKTILHAKGSIEELSFSNIPGKYLAVKDISFDELQVLKYRMGLGNGQRGGRALNAREEGQNNSSGDQQGGGNTNDDNPSNNNEEGNGNNTTGGNNNGSNAGSDNSNASDASNDNRSQQEIEQDNRRSRRRLQENNDPMQRFENLPPIEFVKREVEEGTRYEFHFGGSFELPTQDFLCMGGRGNWGFISKNNGDIMPYVPELNEFGIGGELGPVKFSGVCQLYYDDNTYGDGFRGQIDASFDLGEDNGLFIGLLYQSGEVSGLDYWYFKGKTILPAGIPIPPALSWKGAGLEIGQNITLENDQVIPRRGNLRFGGEIIMVNMNESPEVFKIAGGISAEVTEHFAINSITINAEVGLMGSKLPSENPSTSETILNGTGEIVMDFRRGEFSANFMAYLSIPNPDGGVMLKGSMGGNRFGELDLLIRSDDWHIFVGRPSNQCGVTANMLGMEMSFNTYFMVGLGLEPYSLPSQLLSHFPDVQPSRVAIENGFAHGASWSLSTGRKEWACFYGELDFIVGYDIAFGQAGACPGYPNPGYNGWYATGQMYGAGKVEVGILVDCWLYEGPISLMDMEAAAYIRGGLPKPTYLEGAISSRYSVLDGYIKGSFNFDFSVGDVCVPEVPEVESPAVDLVLIEEISPDNGASNISIGEQPMALFNFNHDSRFDIEIPNPDVNDPKPIIRTFRTKHDAKLYKVVNRRKQLVSATLDRTNMSEGFHEIRIIPNGYLYAGSTYSVDAESFIEERINGTWGRAKNKAGQVIPKQTKRHQFTTTDVAIIEPYQIENQFPEPNRSFVYTRQNNVKFKFFQRAGGVFSRQVSKMKNITNGQVSEFSSPIDVDYYAKFTRVSDGAQALVKVNGNPQSRSVTFNSQGLPTGELYKMEIIRIPENCERYEGLSSSISSNFTFHLASSFETALSRVQSRLNQTSSFNISSRTILSNSGNSMSVRSISIPEGRTNTNYWYMLDNAHEDVLYTTYFGKSEHTSLEAKLNNVSADNKVMLNFNKSIPCIIQLRDNEKLCLNDFVSNANRPTFQLGMTSQNAYYRRLQTFYDDVNRLIQRRILRPAHFQNRNFQHYNYSRFTVNQINTRETLIPGNSYSSIVRPNPNNTEYWNTVHKQRFTILQTPVGEASKFHKIDQDIAAIQNVISNVISRSYPAYSLTSLQVRTQIDNNPDDAVQYDRIDSETSSTLYRLASMNDLDRSLARDEGWGINAYRVESQYQALFSNATNAVESFSIIIKNVPTASMQEVMNQNSGGFNPRNRNQNNWRNNRRFRP